MASIYRKKNSPNWFIQFIDGNGKRRNKSTEFRASDPGETMKARTLRAQMEAKELSRTGTVGPLGGNWDAWVPTALRPILEKLIKAKQKFTLEFPFQPSRRWQQFFIKMKLPHLCFHCLRVTYVNRLRRAGVPREW